MTVWERNTQTAQAWAMCHPSPHPHHCLEWAKKVRVQLPEPGGWILGRQNTADIHARRVRCPLSSNLSKMCINLIMQFLHGILESPGGRSRAINDSTGLQARQSFPVNTTPCCVSPSFPCSPLHFGKIPTPGPLRDDLKTYILGMHHYISSFSSSHVSICPNTFVWSVRIY